MLILSRRLGEAVSIRPSTDVSIEIVVLRIGRHTIKLGIKAPDSCEILRRELQPTASTNPTTGM